MNQPGKTGQPELSNLRGSTTQCTIKGHSSKFAGRSHSRCIQYDARSSSERESAETDRYAVGGHCRTLYDGFPAGFPYCLDEGDLPFGAQPLDADHDDRRTRRERQREMRVEVMIERDTCHPTLPCELQDVGIVGSVQTCFADMQGFPAFRTQQLRRPWRKALIEQDLHHATRCSSICFSSMEAAA